MDYLFSPGADIRGFKVIKPIAQGGVSEVYAVEDGDGIPHTLKIPLPQERISRDEKGSVCYNLAKVLDPEKRTRNEIEMLKRLNHPNIIKLHGLVRNIPIPGTSEKVPGILLEPLENPMTLEEVMKDMPQDDEYLRPWTGQTEYNLTQHEFDPRRKLEKLFSKYERFIPNARFGRPFNKFTITDYKELAEYVRRSWETSESNSHASDFVFALQDIFSTLNQKYGDLIIQIEGGIEDMMRKNIVHMDLKPSNILIDQFQTAKIIDLGMASFADAKKIIWASRRTKPPEGYLGTLHQTADLWALGAIVYEATFGHHPCSERNDVRDIAQETRECSLAIIDSPTEVRLPFYCAEPSYSRGHRNLAIALDKCVDLLTDFKHTDRNYHNRRYEGSSNHQHPSNREFDAFRLFSYLNINPASRQAFRKWPPKDVDYHEFTQLQVNGREYAVRVIDEDE